MGLDRILLICPSGNFAVELVIARSDSDEAIQLRFRRTVKWIASLTLAMTGQIVGSSFRDGPKDQT
jgi:hypothetical protein